jgi:AraC-like DNA-binding protein
MEIKESSWRLKFWRVPHLGNLELMHALNITHDYPPHIHEEYCLVVMLQGVETHVCRGRSYNAFAGCLMLINADEAHSSKSVGTEYRIIHISPKAINRIGFEVSGRNLETPYFSNPVIKDPSVFRALLDLHLKLEQNTSHLEQESDLISAVGLLLARQNKIHSTLQPLGKEPHRIKLVRDYLKSHYAENVSLSQLASIANLSPFYLLRVFHNEVGFPPHEYQTQVRIAHAKRLIQNGHTISQAAHESGFFDQSHLNRNFKRIVGITPGQYLSQSNIVQDTAV